MPSDRYELLELLGDGSQGSTWRARDHAGGQDVAIKVFELQRHDDWKPYDLFERECKVLRGLGHDGIPDYIEYFADEEAGRYFLVMQLMEGRCLRDEVATGQRWEAPALWALLDQVLTLLAHLHERQPPVIHRDIKPANLVQRPDGRVALVDFGGVRVALRPDGGSTVVGTFGYMAPEQLHGEATPATDIYGLGTTVLALAAGMDADKLPRTGLRIDVAAVLQDAALASVVAAMVEPDPTARLSQVGAVREAIAAATPIPGSPAGEGAPAPAGDVPFSQGGALSLLVWLATSVGSILLFIIGDVLLPTAFSVARRSRRMSGKRRQQLDAKEAKTRALVQAQYRNLRALADGHDPERPQSRWQQDNQRKRLESRSSREALRHPRRSWHGRRR